MKVKHQPQAVSTSTPPPKLAFFSSVHKDTTFEKSVLLPCIFFFFTVRPSLIFFVLCNSTQVVQMLGAKRGRGWDGSAK